MTLNYDVNIGLEVHAELSTATKMFCSCKNEFGAPVNTHICPDCLAMPGTLPRLNAAAVDFAIKMGHATHCRINERSSHDRKNYFYSDLPKGYQTTQSEVPLCSGGYLDIAAEDGSYRVGINRIHIEEDTAKLLHLEAQTGSVLIDFNRGGVPLIEIVSEPTLRSAQEARGYLEMIRSILQYLDISDCKMEEGSIRCDCNVSLSPKGSGRLGVRTEMKNVNSFSAAERAIAYEIARQAAVLDSGGTLTQQTLRWLDLEGRNFPMRDKESAADYRYFTDFDLPPLAVSCEHIEELKKELPELPGDRLLRYRRDYDLPFQDAQLLADSRDRADLFDRTVALDRCAPRAALNWIMGDLSRILNESGKAVADTALTPEALADMIALIEEGVISNTAGKTVLEELCAGGGGPRSIVERLGLAQQSDASALEAIVAEVLRENERAMADYRAGKTNVLGFLVGQCMRRSGGKGNPQVLRELVEKALG